MRATLCLLFAVLAGCSAARVPEPPPSPSPIQEPASAANPPADAPTDDMYYADILAYQEYECSPGQWGIVRVEAMLGLNLMGEDASIYLVTRRIEETDACTHSGMREMQYRDEWNGKSTIDGGTRRLTLSEHRTGELPPWANEYERVTVKGSNLVLTCVSRAVGAHEASDDIQDLSNPDTPPTNVTALSCAASEPLRPEGMFEQWLRDGNLLLAPEPGLNTRSGRTNHGDYSALRLGSTSDPTKVLTRQRITKW